MEAMHEAVRKLEDAMQKEGGFQPNGSVQAETRAVLSTAATYIHLLESSVMELGRRLSALEKDSPQVRIAQALERMEVKVDKLLMDRQ